VSNESASRDASEFDDTVSPREAAEDLKTSLTTIYRLIQAGRLVTYEVGVTHKRYIIPRSSLTAYRRAAVSRGHCRARKRRECDA
jgi:excisionase family DNA binding protein